MRPQIGNPKRQSEAAAFHRAVFKAHGSSCYFCSGSKATDAMHVIPRSQLGPKRYACPTENARPGCRRCHDLQTRGELVFPIAVRRKAIRALNNVLTVKIQEI